MKTAFSLIVINIPMLALMGLAYFALIHGHEGFAIFAGAVALLVLHYYPSEKK